MRALGRLHRLIAVLIATLTGLAASLAVGMPAQAADLGRISGSMVATGGAPVAGAEVTLYASHAWGWETVDEAFTDATGAYQLVDVAPGTYRLGFRDLTGDHVTEYWDNFAKLREARDLVVGPGENRTGVNVVVARAGHVAGRVTGAVDVPLADVLVEAHQWSYSPGGWFWDPVAHAWTGTDGSYDLGGLGEGTYRLGFSGAGADHLDEYWDDAASVEAAQDVIVRTGEVTGGKDAQLTQGGAVSGTVTGSSGPLVDVEVSAYVFDPVEDDWSFVASTLTGELGGYRLGHLPAGDYRIAFDDWLGGHLSEYWDDAATLEDATTIEVSAGAEAAGRHAELELGGRITGTMTAPRPVGFVWVSAYENVEGRWSYVGGTYAADDGSYELRGLPGGTYRIGFEDDWGGLASEFWDDVTTVELGTDISVARGETAAGRDAVLAPDPGYVYTNLAAPTISGTPQVGQVLTADPGGWSPYVESYSYEWLADGVAIPGATGSSLTLTAAQQGRALSVRVTASGSSRDPGTAVSAPTAPVTAAPVVAAPVVVPPVPVADALATVVAGIKVRGKPVVGKTLTIRRLVTSLRGSVGYKIQWFSGAAKIKKATRSKLRVTRAMKGKVVSVRVRASSSGVTKVRRIKVGRVR